MLTVSAPENLPIAQARDGDAAAWDVLFRRYQLPLFTYVHELVREESASFDVVQETFISAIRYIGSLREEAKFGSWLFGIAHQKCVQRWRKDRRAEGLIDDLRNCPEEWVDSPGEMLIRQEDGARFMELLEQLPVPQRSALVLHFVEDFSLEEIAEITGANVGTIKSRIHYGKRALRKLLEESES